MFTWDEAKRRANLCKHGIDFVDAPKIFQGLTFTAEDDRETYYAKLRNMKRASTSRKSRTDLRRVRQLTDANMVKDGEAPVWTPAMFARAVARKGLKPVPRKALISLRIDADVIDWFRAQGAGYQSRMNALLRAFMEAHK